MIWNVALNVRDILRSGVCFPFLAASYPDGEIPTTVSKDQYAVSESTTPTGYPTLEISIVPPASATDFTDEGTLLPHASIRLHGPTHGWLSYCPADATYANRLVFEMNLFSDPLMQSVPWWHQWIAPDCIPQKIVF